jgi:hypothetical protein
MASSSVAQACVTSENIDATIDAGRVLRNVLFFGVLKEAGMSVTLSSTARPAIEQET